MRLAQHIETHIHTGDATDTVTLDYEARFLRRKRLVSDGGEPFLVELAETQSLNQGEGFRLDDGRIIAVMAAATCSAAEVALVCAATCGQTRTLGCVQKG